MSERNLKKGVDALSQINLYPTDFRPKITKLWAKFIQVYGQTDFSNANEAELTAFSFDIAAFLQSLGLVVPPQVLEALQNPGNGTEEYPFVCTDAMDGIQLALDRSKKDRREVFVCFFSDVDETLYTFYVNTKDKQKVQVWQPDKVDPTIESVLTFFNS